MDINKKSLGILVLMLLSLPELMASERLNYDYLSVSYERLYDQFEFTSIDGLGNVVNRENIDGNGKRVDLSMSVADNFAVLAGYRIGRAYSNVDSSTKLSQEVESIRVGAIFHTPLNEYIDVVAGVTVINGSSKLELDQMSVLNNDANGGSVFSGVRTMLTQNFEFNGYIERAEIEDRLSTIYRVGSSYHLNHDYSVNLDYSYAGKRERKSLIIGVSRYF